MRIVLSDHAALRWRQRAAELQVQNGEEYLTERWGAGDQEVICAKRGAWRIGAVVVCLAREGDRLLATTVLGLADGRGNEWLTNPRFLAWHAHQRQLRIGRVR